jgi:ElaB/YqjD/DUF883 family membrane-anchored ribosome-binding protein
MNSKPRNFREAMDELDDFSDSTAQDLKSKLQGELDKLEARIRELKPQLDEIKDKVHDEAFKAKTQVEDKLKENPWAAIGLVGLVFFVLGCLFGSRRSD